MRPSLEHTISSFPFVVIGTLAFFVFLTAVFGPPSPSVCGYIVENTVLGSDYACGKTGFTIGADNIIFDCAGHTITYLTYGVQAINRQNITIRNCHFTDISDKYSPSGAISLSRVRNAFLSNIKIATFETGSPGIVLSGVSQSRFSNISIDTRGVASPPLIVKATPESGGNHIHSFSLVSRGPYSHGLVMESGQSNIFSNGIVLTLGRNSSALFMVSSSTDISHNWFRNVTFAVTGRTTHPLLLRGESAAVHHTTFENVTIEVPDEDAYALFEIGNVRYNDASGISLSSGNVPRTITVRNRR